MKKKWILPKSSCASVFAFYGIDNPTCLDDLYLNAVKWFEEIGCTCDKLAVQGKSFSGKQGAFSRIHTRLVKKGACNVDGIELTSMWPDGEYPLTEWRAKMEMSRSPSWFVISIHESAADMSWLLSKVLEVVPSVRPSYGIGYRREMRCGPVLYAVGLTLDTGVYDDAEYDESLRTTNWGCDAVYSEDYRDGIIRDVYPHNFLSKAHLGRQIEGMPFKRWITQDSSRGDLVALDSGISLWSVPVDRTGTIRARLQREGMIFGLKNPNE